MATTFWETFFGFQDSVMHSGMLTGYGQMIQIHIQVPEYGAADTPRPGNILIKVL
jgi:hypothetical protein